MSNTIIINGAGHASDIEAHTRQLRVEDALHATRTALQNAASVASLMLTTECMVSEAPKDDAPMGGGMGGMGDMGM